MKRCQENQQIINLKERNKIWDVVDVQPAGAVVRPAMDCRGAVKIMDHVERGGVIN